jgi:hypothetical protein
MDLKQGLLYELIVGPTACSVESLRAPGSMLVRSASLKYENLPSAHHVPKGASSTAEHHGAFPNPLNPIPLTYTHPTGETSFLLLMFPKSTPR